MLSKRMEASNKNFNKKSNIFVTWLFIFIESWRFNQIGWTQIGPLHPDFFYKRGIGSYWPIDCKKRFVKSGLKYLHRLVVNLGDVHEFALNSVVYGPWGFYWFQFFNINILLKSVYGYRHVALSKLLFDTGNTTQLFPIS